MPLRLPPLPPLRVFEAAGRHLSFRRAAEELNITPSAVSHGVVALEQHLGVRLFVRGPRKLALTPEGADYLAYVSEALALVAIGTQRLPGREAPHRITVSCAPTFAARWLLPRLSAFRQRWPDVEFVIDSSPRHVGFPTDGFDFAIRMSQAPTGRAGWDKLFHEELVPVCSPDYLHAHRRPDGQVDLARAARIHVTTVSEDWQAWLDGTVDEPSSLPALRVDGIQLALDAAQAGLGVAIGRLPLAGDDLREGRLVIANPRQVPTETAYWLVSSASVEHRRELVAFRRWLTEAAQQTD